VSALAQPRLGADEVAHYREQGFVVPRYRLPPPQLQALREAQQRVLQANTGVRPEKLVNVHLARPNAEGIIGDAVFFEIASDPAILDMVELLIGPDIVLWGCQSFCKPPGDGLEVPMHQDGSYWPIRPLATCTAWVAIDDCDAENGCLRVVPGSHREERTYRHQQLQREDVVLTQQICEGEIGDRAAVDVALRAGELSLHDVHLVHGSNPNRSARRRAGLAIRYMPATSVFERDLIAPTDAAGYHVDFSRRPLWLLRGRDVSGRNDFRVGHGDASRA
jgi:ectoine hydroxylase-related dioxygenase (phytanoyl-CoA dioxygenase family)